MTEIVKKNRRGITNETRTVNRRQFTKTDAAPNGLFIGHIESIAVNMAKMDDSKKLFPGYEIPRLVITLASNHANEAERCYITQNHLPVESTIETVPGGKNAYKVDNMFAYIKHLLDVFYFKGRPMTEVEEEALSLNFNDVDENGEYVPVDDQDVINAYTTLFTNVAAMMNGTFGENPSNHPCYKTADNKFINIWFKLVCCVKSKGNWIAVNDGRLSLPTFVGDGVFEIAKANSMPVILRLNPVNETLEYHETKKQPTIGGNNMLGGATIPNMATIAGTPAMPMNEDNPF